MNDQEDQLAALKQAMASLQGQHDAAQQELNTMLENVRLSADF